MKKSKAVKGAPERSFRRPTSDPKLYLQEPGAVNGSGDDKATATPDCVLCGASPDPSPASTPVLFAPDRAWMDSDGWWFHDGICRACTVRAVMVWAASPEGFSAVLPPRVPVVPDTSPVPPALLPALQGLLEAVADAEKLCGPHDCPGCDGGQGQINAPWEWHAPDCKLRVGHAALKTLLEVPRG